MWSAAQRRRGRRRWHGRRSAGEVGQPVGRWRKGIEGSKRGAKRAAAAARAGYRNVNLVAVAIIGNRERDIAALDEIEGATLADLHPGFLDPDRAAHVGG
jgi:hypothetical protein